MGERKHGGVDIGKGLEFIARRYNYERVGSSAGRVLKKTYYPLFDRLDTPIGKSKRDRAEHDLRLIRSCFGDQLVDGASIVERLGRWYVSQPDYGNEKLTNDSPGLDQLKPQLGRILNQNDQMVRDTGYTLDMLGVEFFGDLGNYRRDPDFWSLGSFRVTDNEGQPELRLVDTGLLWTRLDSPPQHQHVNIHEFPAGYVAVNLLIPVVRKRIGV